MKKSNKENVYKLKRRRRVKGRAVRLVALLGVALLTVMFSFVYNVEAFRVKVVEVSGVERVSAEKIYGDSEVVIGDSLINLSTGDMRENILMKQPLVKEAEIKRVIPSKVKIEVRERQPFAYVTNRKQFYLVDREAVVLEKSDGITDPDLFLVESDSIGHAQVGEKLKFPHSDVFMKMSSTLEDYLSGRYSQIRFDQKGIKLFLKDGVYVLLGNGKEINKKLMLVPVIIDKLVQSGEEFEGLNLEYIDVPSFIKKSA